MAYPPRPSADGCVTVNRYLDMYFGEGIVKTVEDFGSQGEYPVHPQLLDWLGDGVHPYGLGCQADAAVDCDQRTYRQSSVVTPEIYQHDPEDRLPARATIQAVGRVHPRSGAGGQRAAEPGDRRPERVAVPAGWIVEELMSRCHGANWTARSTNRAMGRTCIGDRCIRSGGTSPPPQLSTFDGPDREVCTVRRSRAQHSAAV